MHEAQGAEGPGEGQVVLVRRDVAPGLVDVHGTGVREPLRVEDPELHQPVSDRQKDRRQGSHWWL